MFKQILHLFQRKQALSSGETLYRDLIEPVLMSRALLISGLSDSFSARFEQLALLSAIELQGIDARADVERDLVGALITDIDLSFRERSLGDATVKKHAKNHASAFYGRLRAYEGMLHGHEAESLVLTRNLFADAPTPTQTRCLPEILPELRKMLSARHD